jgi:hypothetical protein
MIPFMSDIQEVYFLAQESKRCPHCDSQMTETAPVWLKGYVEGWSVMVPNKQFVLLTYGDYNHSSVPLDLCFATQKEVEAALSQRAATENPTDDLPFAWD